MADVETIARQGTATNLVAAACLTALIYNHALTFDEEVTRIWPNRWSLAKVLFLLNRYLLEAILLFNCISASQPYRSPNFCVFYLRWLVVALTVSNAVVQGILVLRIWAIYRHNKVVLSIAFSFYAGGIITLIGLVIHDYLGEEVLINQTLAKLPGCYASSVPSIIAGFWIGPLIVESVLFTIVASRAFTWWRQGTSMPKILGLLARDSTMYFAIVFALLLANYIVFEVGPPMLSSLLVTPSTTAGCILGSHLLLNLRALADRDVAVTNATTVPSKIVIPLGRSTRHPSNFSDRDVVFARMSSVTDAKSQGDHDEHGTRSY